MRETDTRTDSWEAWSKHVLITLDKLEEKTDNIQEQINDNNLKSQSDIVELKTKAALVAALVGIIASLFMSILGGYIINKIKEEPKLIKSHYELKYIPKAKYTVKVASVC